MEGYVGEKCGVKFKPLSLVMLYRASKGGEYCMYVVKKLLLATECLGTTICYAICAGKLRKRMMPLREVEEFVE